MPERRKGRSPTNETAHRRKPAQSRSRATAEAIREAFVRLLASRDYEDVSIRQVISLAGVGIGSFYEYFSSKDDLGAVCIHLWIKEISTAMRASIEATRGRQLAERVHRLILAQMAAPLQRPRDWAALFRLERRMSGMKEFRRMYGKFVRLHEEALLAGPGWPDGKPAGPTAFAVHAIVYGLASQQLIVSDGAIDNDALRDTVCAAVHGYLATMVPSYVRPADAPVHLAPLAGRGRNSNGT
ncbi:TetR/AcrR family transcriptional regulator [Bradyrhizobium sp.]|uniref:TetR/AcrR family transcriptional regulator n=1 Tax=Bradyrhizobium sp. TaxID=376 RepID=UPI00239BDF20|nr:TetR/AcrR family transcriptional regulator [Bradyrhizobium sp.]MDE2379112.1 TetR/AcrR family transcriptional regulator [Bradyrhizobium sp.]